MEFMVTEEELRADHFVGQEYSDDMKNRSWNDRLGRRTPKVFEFYIRADMLDKKKGKKGKKPIEGPLVFVEQKPDSELIRQVLSDGKSHRAGIDTSVWDKATIHYISADDPVVKGQEAEESSDDSIPF